MNTEDLDDAQLLRSWRNGDDVAGNLLVRRHFEAVYCFFATKSDDPAELTQRAFLGCLESAASFREHSAFRTWLFSIARHVLFNHYRGQKRQRERFADPAQQPVIDLNPSPSAVFAGREEQRLLIDALRTLPLEMQITLELHYWEAMKLADIAQVLELPTGTVKSRLSRARTLLREAVARLAESPALRDSTLGQLEHWAREVRRDFGRVAEGEDD